MPKSTVVAFTLLAFLAFCCPVRANPTFSFTAITNNNPADAAIGEAQLFVDVTDLGSGQVLFNFFNTGPEPSSITDIYFDDGPLSAIIAIDNSDPGVSFSQYARPRNLPAGRSITPRFITAPGLSIDSDSPVRPNGVGPGESVGITFGLLASNDFNDVLADLASGDLRIGIHVQGFYSGGSESFINNGYSNNGIAPAPGSVILCALGTVLVGWLRNKKMF
jgi:hypothetical protein